MADSAYSLCPAHLIRATGVGYKREEWRIECVKEAGGHSVHVTAAGKKFGDGIAT